MTEAGRPQNFLAQIVEGDLAAGKNGGRVVTRFPPEPNGYLHIGHAKSICLNFGVAQEFGGACNLRFDDTNPVKEDVEYVDSIMESVHWLGFDWQDRLYYASDYFAQIYDGGVRASSILTIVRYARNQQTYYRRYATAGFDPNDLGLTVALAIPLALYLGLRGSGIIRWASRAVVVLAIEAVLLSASRTALIVCFAAFGLALWTWRESDLSQKISCLMLFSLLHNPCSTTVYTIYKETGSAKWTALSVAIPLAMGFAVTFLVAAVWRWAGG